MRATVDASVAVKWLVPEDAYNRARLLLGPGIERHAPGLLLAEVANAISKKARPGGEIESGRPFVAGVTKLPGVVRLHPIEILLTDAMETGLRIGHPIYDCLYIACARRTGSVLVTADQGLARAVSKRVTDVEAITLDDHAGMRRVEAAGFLDESSV